MTTPDQPEPSVTPLTPREVSTALRRCYPASVPVRSDASPDGLVFVRMGALGARYLGIGRDHAAAANLLGWHLDRPVMIASCDYPVGTDGCVFTVAADPGGLRPADPGSSLAVPAYGTPAQVLGGQFPASRMMAGLIRLALEAGCRPHLNSWRSGHGRQYRVSLWHTDPDLLHGCIDAGEATGRFAAAYLMWGRGPDERRLTDPKEVRQNLTSCRDLHRAGTAAAQGAHRLARAESPAAARPRSSIRARGAPAIARGADDETARILGEYGTPEKRLEYALMEAGRRKRDAYSAAWAQCEAAGKTAAAKQRYDSAYEAAHAEWTAEVAYVVAEYALELDATAPAASSGTDDPASPYNLGWRGGADMLVSDITRRPSGYDDGQWRQYVAGYAKGAQLHAGATAAYARAAQERARENPLGSLHETASAGTQPVKVQGALKAVPGRDESAAPELAAGPDFPDAPAARLTASPGRRAAGTGIASHAGQGRPGRRR